MADFTPIHPACEKCAKTGIRYCGCIPQTLDLTATPPAACAPGFEAWFRTTHHFFMSDNRAQYMREAWEASQTASRSYEDGVKDALKVVSKQHVDSDLSQEWQVYTNGISACITAILALLPAPPKEERKP